MVRCRWPAVFLLTVALSPAIRATPDADRGATAAAKLSYRPRETLLPDPDVRTGILPNGLHYYVMHNAYPAHGLSLRLGIRAGSYHEQEDERGFAHFVEHMAFRSTRGAPDGGLDRVFAPMGIAFGHDQNAATTYFSTTYRLDFKASDDKAVAAGFRWMGDIADGVLFTPAAVARERGVVLAEKEARNNAAVIVSEQISRFQAPMTRTVNRAPIGTDQSLAAASPAGLRGFYDRWYRPDQAVVIVVGDQPADMLEYRIKAVFGAWRGKGPAPAPIPAGRIDAGRGPDALTLADPNLPTTLTECRIRPGEAEITDGMQYIRRETESQIWRKIIDRRLRDVALASHGTLLNASILSDRDNREMMPTCLVMLPAGDLWKSALEAAQAELRRFARDGPTELETERAIEADRALLRGQIADTGSRTTAAIAEMMLGNAIHGLPVVTARERLHAFDIAVEGLSPERLRARFASDWSGSGPLLSLVSPHLQDRADLLAAWSASEKGEALARFADRKAIPWQYPSFGPPGKVVRREEIAEPGFVRLRFANGTILNFKQSTLEKDSVELRLSLGAGRQEIANGDMIPATLASALFAQGGLGRMSAEDVQASLEPVKLSLALQMGLRAFVLTSATRKDNLAAHLRLLAAYLSDPGFRPTLDDRIPAAVDIMYRVYRSQPQLAIADALIKAVDPENPGQLPPKETLSALRSTDFARILKPALTGDRIEVTIVGDLDEATVSALVASTVGALPPRIERSHIRGDTHFVRFPDRLVPTISTTHQGPPDRAMALLVWPLYVATPARRKEEYALAIAAAIFNNALRRRVRDDLGKSYSPSVGTTMPDGADQGYLQASFESYPADIDQLVAEAKAVAVKLSQGAMTADMLQAVRQPILASAAAARQRNAWWATALSGSADYPLISHDAATFEAVISSIGIDDVLAAARTWLARPPIVTIALPEPARPVAIGGAK